MTTQFDDDVVVPFGKYKGRLLAEMLTDASYFDWLKKQDLGWLQIKHETIYNVIVQAGRPPEDTPEHNAMQVRFLDEDFCHRFIRCLVPEVAASFEVHPQFEVRGVDVDLWTSLRRCFLPEWSWTLFHFSYDLGLAVNVEIKPVVGDDYPAVLRQMKTNGSSVLLVGDYVGTGATREQFIKTFITSGMKVIFLHDVARGDGDD